MNDNAIQSIYFNPDTHHWRILYGPWGETPRRKTIDIEKLATMLNGNALARARRFPNQWVDVNPREWR